MIDASGSVLTLAFDAAPQTGNFGVTRIDQASDTITALDPAKLDDATLVRLICRSADARAEQWFAELYRRYSRKVAGWCLQVCGDRDEAADLVQEVFLRVHQHLDGFREESRFSTWLYTIARRTAISSAQARQRRASRELDSELAPEAADPRHTAPVDLSREQILEKLDACMRRDLKPEEARVVYLHYVDGLTLPAITRLLDLDNRSGAKAHLVGGMRKLRRHFKSWLSSQDS